MMRSMSWIGSIVYHVWQTQIKIFCPPTIRKGISRDVSKFRHPIQMQSRQVE
jgi:hypothetical protein